MSRPSRPSFVNKECRRESSGYLASSTRYQRAWRGWLSLGWALFALLLPLSGSAQPKPKGQNETRAHELYLEARNFHQTAQFEEAASALKEAYALYPQPLIMVKLAEAYEKLGAWEKAIDAYRKVGRTGDQELDTRIVNNIRTLEAVLAGPVEVHISSKVPYLQVTVGAETFTSPKTLSLSRGDYELFARREGYRDVRRTLNVYGAGPIVVELEPEPVVGTVVIRSTGKPLGQYKLWLDDQPLAVPPEWRESREMPSVEVASGRHTLVCVDGERVVSVPFAVGAGEFAEVVCEEGYVVGNAGGGGGGSNTWAWVAMTGAAASLTAGTLLLLDYQNDKELDDRRADLRIKSSSKPVAGGVLLGVGGALAITSALLFADVFGGGEGTINEVGLSPLPEGGAVGTIGGRF